MKCTFALAFLLSLAAAAQTSSQPKGFGDLGAKVVQQAPEAVSATEQVLVTRCTASEGLCFLTMSKATGGLAAKLQVFADSDEMLKTLSDPDVFSPSVASLEVLLSGMRELHKQHLALQSDYKLLVERFNRLAAINAAPPVVYTAPPQPDSRSQAIQMWMMMQNANRPQNFNVNVRDCSRFPALCVN